VAALWSVGDAESREFVVRFYKQGGAVNPARALTQAQRAFIAAGRPPSFWAPFVHMGIASRSPAATSD
jgi:CHAT domain-containing protein